MGRGSQRVENIRWDGSRVRWREGEQQGGYQRREVWEGVPLFEAKSTSSSSGPMASNQNRMTDHCKASSRSKSLSIEFHPCTNSIQIRLTPPTSTP